MFTVNNGGLVTLVMRNTMKLDKIYDVKSFTIFTRVPLHLKFLVAFGSTRTKYPQKVLVCVGALFLNSQDFCFFFLIAYSIKILAEIYDFKSLLKHKIERV